MTFEGPKWKEDGAGNETTYVYQARQAANLISVSRIDEALRRVQPATLEAF